MAREVKYPSEEDKARWWRGIEDAQVNYEMDAEEAAIMCHEYSSIWYDARHGTWRQVRI